MTKLNLGCGYRHREGYINIDSREVCKPDLCTDVTNGLPFPDDSIDEVVAQDFLEHIPIGKTIPLIEEIYRVLKMGGEFNSFTPSTDGRGAFQDPTHVSFWNSNSWLYYMDDVYRGLYVIKAKFTGTIQDYLTDEANHVIHTCARLVKV